MKKIIERYKKVHNLKYDKDVADRMSMSQTAFSNQKNRGSIDLPKLIQSCDNDVNIHWLIKGVGNPRISQEPSRVADAFSDYEASLTDLNSAEIERDDLLEFLLRQQEAVVDYLRTLKNPSSDDS